MQRNGDSVAMKAVEATGLNVKRWAREAAIEEFGYWRYRAAMDADEFVDVRPSDIAKMREKAWVR